MVQPFLNRDQETRNSSTRSKTSRVLFQPSMRAFHNSSIRRILIFMNLSYRYVFTKGSFEDQQLLFQDQSLLNIFSMNLEVPRHHSFLPKISRFKEPPNPLHLVYSIINAPTALFQQFSSMFYLKNFSLG